MTQSKRFDTNKAPDDKFDVIIIGAGPAGLFVSININKNKSVLLLEKNPGPGRKLLMSGSGRCNITHSGDTGDFFNHYGDNYRFLKTALGKFSNHDLIRFFNSRGLNTIIDKNGKVFPSTNNSNDVLDVLIKECNKNKVNLRHNEVVLNIKKVESVFLVKTKNNEYTCDKLVISTGGKSYPATGATGDGYGFAKSLGHTIVLPKPALTPVYPKNYKFGKISGVSLQDRTVYLYRDKKKIKEHRGDIGFTHNGLSGPGILDFSRYMEKKDILKIDFVNRKRDDFEKDLIDSAQKEGKISIKTFLKRYEIPGSLVKMILLELGLEPEEKLATIDKKMRMRVLDSFSEYPFEIEKTGGFDIAMTTTGGVVLKDVSSKTMESKLVKSLYFAGEVLDIDGDTGGYNIQAAFSTGYLAAAAVGADAV